MFTLSSKLPAFAVIVLFTIPNAAHPLWAQSNYPPELPGSTAMVYKTVGDVELKMWTYKPDGHDSTTDKRPAVVFFFGGGWKAGSPAQFEKHCQCLAARGIFAATADYRVASRHRVKANACVEDAKTAVRWLRTNADRLGIDPNRICAGGGSAGGHTACCTALIEGFDATNEDTSVSSVPNAMALFNPAVMIAELDNFPAVFDEQKFADIASRTGVPPSQISPVHHVRSELPPTIIFHGKADSTVPFSTVAEFTRRMVAAGNRCELKGFAEAPHGFFNAPKGNNPEKTDRSDQWHRRTLLQLDNFLTSLGWVNEAPTVQVVDHDFVSLRGKYSNSLVRFDQNKKGHVAFLGGSITEMNGYRPMICDWLQTRFPDTEFTFTNAGISSTCSNTAAFRLERDVLSKGPVDLLFVEFAVNDDQDAAHSADACIQGMEGVIRHTRLFNPNADIVMTHFVNPSMLESLKNNKTILSAGQHEKVARHYGVSSVYLSKVVAAAMESQKLTWKQFGGTHPGPTGNRMAADLATSILEAAWKGLTTKSTAVAAHTLPAQQLLTSSFVNGSLVMPKAAANADWVLSQPDWESIAGGKRDRFLNIPMLWATKPGAATSFAFKGNAIGAFVSAGPDSGQLEVQIDDGKWKSVELFHRYSKGLHYPRTVMFATDLQAGQHTIKLRITESHHANSTGHAARIMGFSVNQ